MQFNCRDYYRELRYGEGCCLKCLDAHPGCLCYSCKCKQCYWYKALMDGTGVCEKKYELIKRRKIDNFKRRLLKIKANNKLYEKKKQFYKDKDETYTCQKCQFIIDGGNLEIIKGKIPLCVGCDNKLKLTEKEITQLQMEVEEEVDEDDF